MRLLLSTTSHQNTTTTTSTTTTSAAAAAAQDKCCCTIRIGILAGHEAFAQREPLLGVAMLATSCVRARAARVEASESFLN